MKTYPNSLRRHRKVAGLRQCEISIALGLGGSTERISKWENGHAMPQAKSLLLLAKLYQVSPQELYDEMSQPPVEESAQPEEMLCQFGKHMVSRPTSMVSHNEPEPNAFWKSDPNDANLV